MRNIIKKHLESRMLGNLQVRFGVGVGVQSPDLHHSVEQLDNPDLVGKPVIVGGDPKQRGVVSAASYKARKFGVHSAMPMSRAVRLCPDAIILPVRIKRYVELSKQIHAIFQQFTPQIEPISLDEAFLDVTGSLRLFGSAEKIGRAIKDQVREKLVLVASVGIAANKFLAKLASDLDKPDGFVVITEKNRQQTLDPLPVSKIWGVGKVTEKALKSKGINTIRQLRETSLEILKSIFGDQTAHVLRLAQGVDNREVEANREAKSISSEQTFATDITDKDILLGVLLSQVEDVAQRLRINKLEAKTITLKLRYEGFKLTAYGKLADLLNANFDRRRKIYNVNSENIEMVEEARSVGASAKFTGSGGAIVGTYKDERMFKLLKEKLKRLKVKIIKPRIGV